MSWCNVRLLLCVALFLSAHLSQAQHKHSHHKHAHTAVIVGKVSCNTCFQHDFDKATHFISGASVAVECRYGASPKPIFRREAKTGRNGEFRVRLPPAVSKHVKRIQACTVELIRSSQPYCDVASTATSSSSLRLKSRRHGMHVFSAGFFTFTPQKQPTMCSQKPTLENFEGPQTFPPPLKDPTTPGDLPPLPRLPIPNIPLPELPALPTLPPLPVIPRLPGILPPLISRDEKTKRAPRAAKPRGSSPASGVGAREMFFPPNPLQPQPPLIPNPFQPPPPLIPNPFQPSPPSLFPSPFQPSPPPTPFINLPPISGLSAPPSPPPPAFPFTFPPFANPFFPPRAPGAPPATTVSP